MPTVRQLSAWGLDYVYAGWQQVRSLSHRRGPDQFDQGDPSLPALVLLPGVYETWHFLEPVATTLNARGFRIFTVPELAFNRMPIPRSAEIVATVLQRLQSEHGVSEFLLVAHSKGGLIGKQLMLDLSAKQPPTGAPRRPAPVDIVGLVAIATPFSGSRYAQFMFSRTLRAFSPRDPVVRALLTHEQINARIVSIYGEFDPHIPGGSALAGARNIELPVSGHFKILKSALVHEAVEREIAALVEDAADEQRKDATHES